MTARRAFNASYESSSVFSGPLNADRRIIAQTLLESLAYNQLNYLKKNGHAQEITPTQLVENITGGLFNEKNSRTRLILTKESLQEAVKTNNTSYLVRLYASKCGDFLRAFFDTQKPNGDIPGNIVYEAETLALLQELLSGNEPVKEAAAKGTFHFDQYLKRSVVQEVPQDLEPQLKQTTTQVLTDNLGLINVLSLIHTYNNQLAEKVFHPGVSQNMAIELESSLSLYGLNYHHQGYFRPLGPEFFETEEGQKWQPLRLKIIELFHRKKN